MVFVDAAGEEPGLGGVEGTVHDTVGAIARVGVDALERHYERVVHQVVVHHAVEDVDHAILAARGKEREPLVDRH